MNHVTLGMNWSGKQPFITYKNVLADPEKIFDLSGRSMDILSTYYTATTGRSLLFGEFSFAGKAVLPWYRDFHYVPSGRLTINGLYRNYSPGYGLHSRGQSNNASGCNEKGIREFYF